MAIYLVYSASVAESDRDLPIYGGCEEQGVREEENEERVKKEEEDKKKRKEEKRRGEGKICWQEDVKKELRKEERKKMGKRNGWKEKKKKPTHSCWRFHAHSRSQPSYQVELFAQHKVVTLPLSESD